MAKVDLAAHAKKIAETRQKAKDSVSRVGASPVAAQLAFLKGLAADKKEAEAFMKDPKKYAVAHGILFDPGVIELVTQHVLVNPIPIEQLTVQLGPAAAKEVLTLRAPGTTAAWPAAVAAIAAVVAAGAAVVTLVVTLVRSNRPQDLVALRGLGPQGITLPSGNKYGF
jgi:hypothetical protein